MDVEFNLRIEYGSLVLTEQPYLVDIAARDMGQAENVYSVVDLVGDGAIVSSQRRDNREIALRVYVEGTDSVQRADGYAALVREADRDHNRLIVGTTDGLGPSTAYDTFKADIGEPVHDYGELAGLRFLDLTIPALPFGRSVDLTEVAGADAEAPDFTLLDDGSSATGWSSTQGAVSSASGKVVGPDAATSKGESRNLTRTFAEPVDWATAGTSYLVVEASAWMSQVRVSGLPLTEAMRLPGADSSLVEAWYELTDSHDRFEVVTIYGLPPAPTDPLEVDRLRLADKLPVGRERLLVLDVGGSARTAGSLSVTPPTSEPLGSVLVATCPPGSALLSLWPYRVDGGTLTDDADAVSGEKDPLVDNPKYEIPAGLVPEGAYRVLVQAKATAPGDSRIYFSDGVHQSTVVEVLVALTTTWQIVSLGKIALPSPRVRPGADGVASFHLDALSGDTAVVGGVWLVHEDAALTWVEAGDVDDAVLTIDAPSLDLPSGGVWVDGSWADSRAMPPYGHVLRPGRTEVRVVTTGCSGAVLSAAYYPRWIGAAAT